MRIKSLLCLLLAGGLGLHADEAPFRYVTLQNTADPDPVSGVPRYASQIVLNVQAWEAVQLVNMEAKDLSIVSQATRLDGGVIWLVRDGIKWSLTQNAAPNAIIQGPANVVWDSYEIDPEFGVHTRNFLPMYATFKIFPGQTTPDKTLLLASGTNNVTITLESSTNLVTWSLAASKTMTNVPVATFFRMKLAE